MSRRILAGLGTVACVLVLGLAAVNLVWPQRNGVLALTQVFAPYLSLALLVFLPVCLVRGTDVRLLRVLLLTCGIVFLVRFLPGTVALPRAADPSALPFGATTWNLELGLADPDAVVETIRSMPAGVVGLVELTHAHSDPIAADQAIALKFPYQVLKPRGGSTGLGLLSSWPIADDWSFRFDTPILSTSVTPPGSRRVAVVVAHPLPASLVRGPLGLPTYDATGRDAAIGLVRTTIDPILAAGTPLVLFGDFNVVDREVGYGDLVAGLTDAQHAVGLGPGLTWRPPDLKWLPMGLLRIDAVFSANGLEPLTVDPDCTPRGSDHCILYATLELRRPAP